MPMRIGFHLPASRAMLNAALEGLVQANMALMRARRSRPLPALYASGVRYSREPLGKEDWLTADQVLKRKVGDCEDLAAWRAAEYRMEGLPARAVAIRTGPKQFHAVVEFPDGSLEDPSAMLGMRKGGR